MSQVQDPPIVASQSAIIEAHSTEDLRQQVRAVVHDFNDILGVIVGYSELLLRNIQEDDPARKGIAEIRRAADRGVSLTQSLLRSYRNEALELEVLDINELLQYSQPFFERLIGDGLELHIVFGDNLDPVRLNRSQAEQVITNLLTNARDAMPTGGRLIVESAALELTEEHSEIHLGIPAGRYTTLAVIDTGVGMDAETRPYIFEPFFTTKERRQGTGIGLATVNRILKQNGGYASVESKVGAGTTFKIFLPAAADGRPGEVPPAAG